MKDENLARGAKDTKSAMTYGGAYTIAAGTAEVLEFGVAYGPKGEFGCYKTKCTGVVTDLSVSAGFAHTTFSKFDNIPGKSYVVGAGASIPFTEVVSCRFCIMLLIKSHLRTQQTVMVFPYLPPC